MWAVVCILQSFYVFPLSSNALIPGLTAAISQLSSLPLMRWCEVQEQADAMSPEPVAGPGDPPGVYGCDYNHLMRIMAHVAAAREGLLHGDHEAAVVSTV